MKSDPILLPAHADPEDYVRGACQDCHYCQGFSLPRPRPLPICVSCGCPPAQHHLHRVHMDAAEDEADVAEVLTPPTTDHESEDEELVAKRAAPRRVGRRPMQGRIGRTEIGRGARAKP